MALPGASNKTIADLVPDVIDALQQRTDVASIAPRYIRRALQEITESNPFEELRTTGPTVSLTTGTVTYPVATFLNDSDDVTIIESFAIYVDLPNNTTVSPLNYRTPKAIESMISPATQGIPAWWTRYGTKIMLGPTPNAGYSVFMRYQKRHPFPDDAAALSGQPLFIPASWEEVIVYSAAQRIAVVKRWNDQAQVLHDILYGDPEFQASQGKRGRPGLMEARLYQVERDQKFSTRQLMPRVGHYNPR